MHYKLHADQSVSLNITRVDLFRLILAHLYREPEVLVQELSQSIGVDLSALIPALDLLEKRGFIIIAERGESVENYQVSLQEMENFIIGLDLGGTKLYGALCDLTGNIVHEKVILHNGKSGEDCFDLLVNLIRDLKDVARQEGYATLGIAVDVPGHVEMDTGTVVNAPAVKMKNFPLRDRLVSEFGGLVWVDNDLKQASLGEAWFGLGRDYSNVVLLSIGTGIAASTVIDGKVFRGAHSRQGELGWMIPGPTFLGRKYRGFGALETEASGPGILNRAKKILKETKEEVAINDLTSESVFDAAKKEEAWAERCIDETLDYLAILIGNIMAFYDPGIIILSGGVSQSIEMIIPKISKRIDGCVLTEPNIQTSDLLYKANVLGAIINFIHQCPEFIE